MGKKQCVHIIFLAFGIEICYNKIVFCNYVVLKKEFRDFVGISYSTMSKLEKGENTTVEVLEKICLKLGCGINDIMEILPDDPENGIENDVE